MVFMDFFNVIIVVVIGIGIILFYIYYKKSINYNSNTTTNKDTIKDPNKNLNIQSIYDFKVSNEFKKMFTNPSIDLGFQEYDKNIVHPPQSNPTPVPNLTDSITINPQITSTVPLSTLKIDKIDTLDKIDKIDKIDILDNIDKIDKIDKIDILDNIYDYNIIDNIFKKMFTFI
jgi:hypothetical protein